MVANFFPAGSLEALGILLRIFAVGLEKVATVGVGCVVVEGTVDGTSTPGAMDVVDEDGPETGLTGG